MAEAEAEIQYIRTADLSIFSEAEVLKTVLADRGSGTPRVTISAFTALPGMAWRGGPTHVHANQDQFFYVLDGTLSLEIADKSFEIGPGQLAFIPMGTSHRNWNGSTAPLTYLEIVPGQLGDPPIPIAQP